MAQVTKNTDRKAQGQLKPRCGLCGKRGKLMKTDCCGNWICDDYDNYVLFSFARNSCVRNHDRYTLCAFHAHEGHRGKWAVCQRCRRDFDTEDYVWYGTNEYNFVKLQNSPKFKPTHCAKCDLIIRRGEDCYTETPKGKYICERCYPMFKI